MSNIATTAVSLVGGVPITPSQGFFTVSGKLVHRHGDVVLPHPFHPFQTTVSARFFTCDGLPVTLEADLATCLHPVVGHEFVQVG